MKASPVMAELKETRNFKGGFDRGLWAGLLHGRIITFTKGKEPWTINDKNRDSLKTKEKKDYKEIEYPKKDDVLTFDLLANLQRSGTNHDHDQPSHLRVTNLYFKLNLAYRSGKAWSTSQWRFL